MVKTTPKRCIIVAKFICLKSHTHTQAEGRMFDGISKQKNRKKNWKMYKMN